MRFFITDSLMVRSSINMSTRLLDLPTELQVQMLQYLTPPFLFHNVRLVSKHMRSCAEDVFRNEILPRFQLNLFVYVEASPSDTIYSPSINVQLNFALSDALPASEIDGRDVVTYKLAKVDPPDRRERAVAKWKDELQSQAMVMRMCLPPSYLITLRGKQWQRFMMGNGEGAEDDSLIIDWKKMVAAYFKEMSSYDDIAGRFSSMRPMFPIY